MEQEKETEKRRLGNHGSPQELQEFSGLEIPVSSILSILFHLYRVGGGSIQVLWPTSKITCNNFLDTLPSTSQVLIKGASSINRALLNAPGLLTWSCSSSKGQHPNIIDAISTAQLLQACQNNLAHSTQRPLLHKATFLRLR